MSKGKKLSNWDFKIMSFLFKIRDFFKNPMNKIEKIDVKEGEYVLEYGCGSGSFTIPLAEVVGPSGRIYAADIHPLSSEKVKEKAEKNELENIKTIETDCNTNLNEKSIDVVVLIDVLHTLNEYKKNLEEFHRVLKNNGCLWVDDHHYDLEEIRQKIMETNLFEFVRSVDSFHKFNKIPEEVE